MARTHRFLLSVVGALALAAMPAGARPPVRRRPPPTQVAPTPPPAPMLVPADVTTMANNLRRLHIYVAYGGDASTAFGAQGTGTRLWFVLPSCRPQDIDTTGVDTCPIERLEVTAREGGNVTVGRMTTVLDGEVPRRVQAFVVAPETRFVSIRLVNQRGEVRYEGVVEGNALRELPRPVGTARPDGGFALDFTQYPGR